MKSYQMKKLRSEEICNILELLEMHLREREELLGFRKKDEEFNNEDPWYSEQVEIAKAKVDITIEIMKIIEKSM